MHHGPDIARRFVELNGHRVSYLTTGDSPTAPTLLLVHPDRVNREILTFAGSIVALARMPSFEAAEGRERSRARRCRDGARSRSR